MQIDIAWDNGVTMKFGSQTKIKDQFLGLQPKLIEQLTKCDYLAFVEFFKEIDYCINDTLMNNLENSDLDTIIALSQEKGFDENSNFCNERPKNQPNIDVDDKKQKLQHDRTNNNVINATDSNNSKDRKR